MSIASRVTPRDARRCFSLVSECRELGADTQAWQRHLVDGLREILPARVGICGNMRDFGQKHSTSLGTVRSGWQTQEAEHHWLNYALNTPVELTPEYPALTGAEHRLVTRTCDQLWGRAAWTRSRAFNERHKPCGIDDYIMSLQRLEFADLWLSLWMHRGLDDPPFTRREWWIVHVVHGQIGGLVGGPLASPVEPNVADLTQRRREVLDAVLDGDSEKQVAARLGLQPATVHEHILAIYRHFSVTSRAELMAWFVGRERPRIDA